MLIYIIEVKVTDEGKFRILSSFLRVVVVNFVLWKQRLV